jgi:integrase
MTRVVTPKLTTNKSGGFSARKRIPADVRERYHEFYGKRAEDWLNIPGPVTAHGALAKVREWATEIEARFHNIRAEQRGEGRTLTQRQAHALCGEWYHWFVARHEPKEWEAAYWEHLASDVSTTLSEAIWQASGKPYHPEEDPFSIWDDNTAARESVRPIIADHAESAQFLHAKGLTLEAAARELFLDTLIRYFFRAMKLLERHADGDHRSDKWPARFPKFERTADPALTPWALFEGWISAAKPAVSTVDRWRGVFLKLKGDFPEHSAAAITPEEAQAWADGLISADRTALTVRDVWVVACRTVFTWAVKKQLLTRNPFAAVHVTVRRKARNRPSPELSSDEIRTILSGALAIGKPKTKMEAAKRWVPWLQAYTGARAGEITQLRGADVIEQDGTPAIKITPEAGTVKTRQARLVPLHGHLIEQGFLEFAKVNGTGPLFYSEPTGPVQQEDPTNPRRRRSVTARVRLAEWVRDLGATDRELQPTHAWRDTFKAIGHRRDISERILDAIAGHAPATIGRGYGPPTLHDMAEALKRFPRYEATKGSSQSTGGSNG